MKKKKNKNLNQVRKVIKAYKEDNSPTDRIEKTFKNIPRIIKKHGTILGKEMKFIHPKKYHEVIKDITKFTEKHINDPRSNDRFFERDDDNTIIY